MVPSSPARLPATHQHLHPSSHSRNSGGTPPLGTGILGDGAASGAREQRGNPQAALVLLGLSDTKEGDIHRRKSPIIKSCLSAGHDFVLTILTMGIYRSRRGVIMASERPKNLYGCSPFLSLPWEQPANRAFPASTQKLSPSTLQHPPNGSTSCSTYSLIP